MKNWNVYDALYRNSCCLQNVVYSYSLVFFSTFVTCREIMYWVHRLIEHVHLKYALISCILKICVMTKYSILISNIYRLKQGNANQTI